MVLELLDFSGFCLRVKFIVLAAKVFFLTSQLKPSLVEQKIGKPREFPQTRTQIEARTLRS